MIDLRQTIYECDCCGEVFGELELHNHEPDDMLWCRPCLENEYEEQLNAETSARLCVAGLAHVFERADTMVYS